MTPTPHPIKSALATLTKFVEHLRPTRSPYILVVLFGIAGLLVASALYNAVFWEPVDFYFIFAPISLTVILYTLFIFLYRADVSVDMSADEMEEHFGYSRSLCISTAMICLVIGCWRASLTLPTWLFVMHYGVCTLQILVFVVYSAARIRRPEPRTSHNNIQIALLTSWYLAAATTCISAIDTAFLRIDESVFIVQGPPIEISTRKGTSQLNPFSLSASLFYGLWGWCQIYWILRTTKITIIRANPPN